MNVRYPALLLLLLGSAAPAAGQRPWLTASTRIEHDSQPRSALFAAAQLGGYLVPSITLAADVGGHHATAADATTSAAFAGATVTLGAPALRTGVEASGRALLGAPDAGVTPLYRALARYNAGAGVSVRARAERDRYTATLSALDTLVLVDALELALDRSSAPGWAGEAVLRRESYGDGNPVSTAYIWLLAPLARAPSWSLRLGYAAGWQDAPESRWVLDRDGGAGQQEGQQADGRYDPYYTPHDVLTHSALANAALAVGAGWLLADASVGLRATERAPALIRQGVNPGRGNPVRVPAGQLPAWQQFHERSFTPYRAAAALVVPTDERTSLTVGAELSRTAFYRIGTVRLSVARAL
jgi:hypothetical protein